MAIDPVSAARAYQQAAQAMQGGGAPQGGESVDFGGLVQQAIRQAGESASVAEQQGLGVQQRAIRGPHPRREDVLGVGAGLGGDLGPHDQVHAVARDHGGHGLVNPRRRNNVPCRQFR